MTASDRLRAALTEPGVLQAPGVQDCPTALLATAAGFGALHLSGAIASATTLGLPDLGYLHGTDVAELARRITAVTDVPLIADADTGYGNPLHAQRTVEQYARAGVAGLHLEDQVSPKRCGHMAGKAVLDRAEAAQKVRAAVDADSGLVIIARTDALGVLGMTEAIARVTEFAAAGADLVFVEGAADEESLARLHGAVPELGLVVNVSEADPRLRPLPLRTLAEHGVRVALYPVAPALAALHAARQAYGAIAADGSAAAVDRLEWDELTDLLGLPALLADEARYGDGP
ncbi:MAG TPA: isocitrate lyase/PEP mutase family protein [Candidatus Nanopelagicales bacterium]|nr:isocitrate lyase/PEP mutase family protein [Candidatus Nanopelagicales bacterium]